MPAEWEPHDATWLAWPHSSETWQHLLPRVTRVWVEIARELRAGELVRLLVPDEPTAESVSGAFGGDLDGIELVKIPTNDTWIRDYGPTFVAWTENGTRAPRLAGSRWNYNCWGEKYPPWEDDARAAGAICALIGAPSVRARRTLEGGALEVDGEGTLLTTRSCALHLNRNPSSTASDLEAEFERLLGVERTIWLGGELEGDDTDGHVDNLARFVRPGTAVFVAGGGASAEDRARLLPLEEDLRCARDARGRVIDLVPLPLPRPVVHGALRAPASYANFYIGNEVVLVPTYRSPADDRALGILCDLFPDRRVVGIDAFDLVFGQGSIHCITQQQPRMAPHSPAGSDS